MPVAERFRIDYEGPGEGGDYLGNAQANFVLRWHNHRAREVSILVNEPALQYIAEQIGVEMDEATEERVVRAIGERLLQRYESGEGHIEPFIWVSRSLLQRAPELVEHVKTTLAAS